MLFAFTYRLTGQLQDATFFGSGGDGTTAQTLFFSFTTLTTTGYGNLVPAANPGQTMAVGEMLLGQLFLATAIAKVITAWTPKRRARARGVLGGLGADAAPDPKAPEQATAAAVELEEPILHHPRR